MGIAIKRVYEKPVPGDGARILVDRLWPRGVSKERAKLDLWLKDIAPSWGSGLATTQRNGLDFKNNFVS